MPHSEYHLQRIPIPAGYQIYEERLAVAGVGHHKKAAARFIAGQDWTLEFEREMNNPHDPNAIRIVGCSRKGERWARYHVGYVDRDLAARIIGGNYWGLLQPRLLHTYMSDAGFVEIGYQIVGPKDRHSAYASSNRPAPDASLDDRAESNRPPGAPFIVGSRSARHGCSLALALAAALVGALLTVL